MIIRDNASQAIEKVPYQAPQLSPLGSIQAFVLNGGETFVTDAGNDDFSS